MRVTVHLKFQVDVESEGEAWEIADRLESAAMKKDYVGISAWVESEAGSRAGVLVPEGQEAPASEAMRTERAPGAEPTAVGDAGGVLSPSVFGEED